MFKKSSEGEIERDGGEGKNMRFSLSFIFEANVFVCYFDSVVYDLLLAVLSKWCTCVLYIFCSSPLLRICI